MFACQQLLMTLLVINPILKKKKERLKDKFIFGFVHRLESLGSAWIKLSFQGLEKAGIRIYS